MCFRSSFKYNIMEKNITLPQDTDDGCPIKNSSIQWRQFEENVFYYSDIGGTPSRVINKS